MPKSLLPAKLLLPAAGALVSDPTWLLPTKATNVSSTSRWIVAVKGTGVPTALQIAVETLPAPVKFEGQSGTCAEAPVEPTNAPPARTADTRAVVLSKSLFINSPLEKKDP